MEHDAGSDIRNAPNTTEQSAFLPAVPVFVALYLAALAMLAWRLGSRPDFLYNWESYTARGLIDFINHPTWDVFRLNDGLMTDSGRSAAVVAPSWLGFKTIGLTYLGLRFPLVVIGAFAVPLTWFFGRRLFSDAIGLTAALLVMTSQVFLLYGRTGTMVGMSVAPAVLGYLLLWMCVQPADRRWPLWLIAFQASLIINSYYYSPIRFLWPIAVVLFAVELALRSGQRQRFLISLLVTVAVLPLALTVLRPGPMETPIHAVTAYYNGRGEQLFRMNQADSGVTPFLRDVTEEERQRIAQESETEQSLRLIRQNAWDLTDLLIDRETRPAITDFWNPHGRLYAGVLVPFFLGGTLLLIARFFWEPRARLLLALFWGFSLPLLLTTQVHIGRLVYVVPLLGIVCALPIMSIVRLLELRQPPSVRPGFSRWAGFAIGAMIVLAGAVPSLTDWQVEFPQERMDRVKNRIIELTYTPPAQQLVYVFSDMGGYEIENLRIAELEMSMSGYLRFMDLTSNEQRGNGPIPLLYGAMLTRVGTPSAIPGYCTNIYLVEPDAVERFHAESDEVARSTCSRPLTISVLDV
jgi:4-amino-4-deoxy-L-arabinose transferase-like glycosyltransferase